ncbi:hypothetical protein AG1IA_06018 [Rhizoctonia solani AG-1 IA]|uniref:Transmembrane protein n=1 Tax=Thanatephorus cucumeris (strain AG1-IA) TaxID=983506 RepID=L8WT25_THACA|nr:hypothetical protein AG1IA_06018 [Rhizoctonia solani AG-1 IA]
MNVGPVCPVSSNRKFRDAKQAWTVWSQGIAVTTALFAGVEAQLFNLIDETTGPTDSLTQAFRIFSYLGLLSNLLATTSALFVLERVSGLPTRARRLSLLPNSLPRQVADGTPLPAELLHPLRETALLRAFGMDATWGYTITMFYLFSIAGCLSVFVQLSLYLFIRESVAVAVVLTSVIMFGLTPLVVLTLRIVHEFLFDLLGWARAVQINMSDPVHGESARGGVQYITCASVGRPAYGDLSSDASQRCPSP